MPMTDNVGLMKTAELLATAPLPAVSATPNK